METLKNLIKHGIQIIDNETADKIIETRTPRGSFVTIEGEMIVAIENEAGDAFVENFKTEEAAVLWITSEVDTEQAYEIDRKLTEAEERGNLTVKGLTILLSGVNEGLEVKRENGMPVEIITIEMNNSGMPYVMIC